MDKEKLLEKFEFFKTIAARLQYTIHPIATEDEVTFFESKFNVRLPEDFRWFVLNVANGITNKIHLNTIIDQIDFKGFFHEEDEYNPSLPFTPTQRVYFGEQQNDNAYPEDPGPTTYDTERKHWKGVTNGYIDLIDGNLLIINGSEYGTMWLDNMDSNREVFPNKDEEAGFDRLTFGQWIIYKLDRVIEEYQPRSHRTYSKPAYTYPSQPRHNDYVVTNVETPETTWSKLIKWFGFK
jgi:hypothetical protein